MADLGTMAAPDGAREPDGAAPRRRRITPPRGLPGSRAVVGALLVTAAAVGVFAAYLDATAAPDTRYLVALRELPPGTTLSDGSLATLVGFEAIDLPADQADAVVSEDQVRRSGLDGVVTLAPLAPGDLVLNTHVVSGGDVAEGTRMSFAVERSRALGDSIKPGDRVDVLATYGGGGGEAYTLFVVRDVLVVDARGTEGGLGEPQRTLTVVLETAQEVQALAHAANDAEMFVTRTTGLDDGEAGEAAPGYVPPGPDDAGFAPDGDAAQRGGQSEAQQDEGGGDGGS